MSSTIVLTGDTKTVRATFTDINNDPIDTDGTIATFTCYNEDGTVNSTGTASKTGFGVYSYEWVVPDEDGVTYILEMSGTFSSEPQLNRMKVKAKFKI